MANYLVTGAAGFIGRSIAAELIAGGEQVRGIDNLSTGKRENLAGLEAMDFIEADLTDADACATACQRRGRRFSPGGNTFRAAFGGRSDLDE